MTCNFCDLPLTGTVCEPCESREADLNAMYFEALDAAAEAAEAADKGDDWYGFDYPEFDG